LLRKLLLAIKCALAKQELPADHAHCSLWGLLAVETHGMHRPKEIRGVVRFANGSFASAIRRVVQNQTAFPGPAAVAGRASHDASAKLYDTSRGLAAGASISPCGPTSFFLSIHGLTTHRNRRRDLSGQETLVSSFTARCPTSNYSEMPFV